MNEDHTPLQGTSDAVGTGRAVSQEYQTLRSEARAWIVSEAYNGRPSDPNEFDGHETYVQAPSRARVDDFTPLPLPSVVPSASSPFDSEPAPRDSSSTSRNVWKHGWVVPFALAPVLIGMLLSPTPSIGLLVILLACVGGGVHGFVTGKTMSARRTPHTASTSGERLTMKSYEVVPEIAYAYRLIKAAPERLLRLQADPSVIRAAERAWEVVLREVPRLPVEAWESRYTRGRYVYTNLQRRTEAYERILNTAGEVLVMLRAAEEKENALAPHLATTGPWTTLSLEPVVVDLLEQARMAQDIADRTP